jgi:hypothetical protein
VPGSFIQHSLVGVDIGHAGMAALEVQAAGHDHPVEQV